jgi:hypothetical protein
MKLNKRPFKVMNHDNAHTKLWCMVTGVEHVGGDMFEKVPGGCDAIFMKVNFELYLDVEKNTCFKRKVW